MTAAGLPLSEVAACWPKNRVQQQYDEARNAHCARVLSSGTPAAAAEAAARTRGAYALRHAWRNRPSTQVLPPCLRLNRGRPMDQAPLLSCSREVAPLRCGSGGACPRLSVSAYIWRFLSGVHLCAAAWLLGGGDGTPTLLHWTEPVESLAGRRCSGLGSPKLITYDPEAVSGGDE